MLLAWHLVLRTSGLENKWEESESAGPVGGHGASLVGDNEALARFRARFTRVEILWRGWGLGKDLGSSAGVWV